MYRSGSFLLLLSNQRRTIVNYSQFHPSKNDFAFAFLMAVVFAVIVGAVAGTLNLVREQMGVDSAKEQWTNLALRGPGEQSRPIPPSGARQ
jgi:hypothetical protein